MLRCVAGIEYELVRKNIKNLYVRVLPPDGRVLVSAPRFASAQTIDCFVSSRASWIRKQQEAQQSRLKNVSCTGKSGEMLPVWGKRYKVSLAEGSRFGLVLSGDEALLTVRKGSTAEQREAYVRKWYRQQLCAQVEQLLPLWEARTGLHCAEWRTKDMKTRWGSCNTRERRIWLNVQLAKYSPECLEYVILHELAHLREPSHNAAFKAILDRYMPDWRRIRKKLNS